MKLLLLLMAAPSVCFSQTIKEDKFDKFKKVRRIETTIKWAKQAIGCGIGFGLRSVDSTIFITIKGYNCAVGVIGKDEQAIFLLENDSTLTVYSKGFQSYGISEGNIGNNWYQQEYYINLSDVKRLSESKVKSVRRYLSDSYADVDLGKQGSISDVCEVFLKAYRKRFPNN